MRKATTIYVDELARTSLFVNVDEGDYGDTVARVHSWNEAIDMATHTKDEGLRVEASNEVRRPLPQAEYNSHWSSIVAEARRIIEPVVRFRTRLLQLPGSQFTVVVGAAEWDLIGAFMEHEYEQFVKTRFFRDAAEWYLKGHFVCGWHYRNGIFTPIIY